MSGTKVETAQTYTAQTDEVHCFEVKPKAMSVSFLLADAGQVDSDYPKYLLESNDGSYSRELLPSQDLVVYGQYFQLRFEDLRPKRLYTLTRRSSESGTDIVFRDVPYVTIVDQKRETHKLLYDHVYALATPTIVESAAVEPWAMDGDK